MSFLRKEVASFLAIVSACGSTATACLYQSTVETASGQLQGFENAYYSNVSTFLGVPYGGDTSGQYRWKPPRPAAPWSDVQTFDNYGFVCPDGRAPNGALSTGIWNVSEDCLNVNIWSGAQEASERLPVYVFFHGAGATGNDYTFDGSYLASQGAVIVVPNHRINVFGYLAHPELTAESPHHASGNYAYLDNIHALEWVQENIGAFGGDPGRVTIGGQSAGCSQTNILSLSELTSGLFHGAICESGIRFPNDTYIAEVAENYQKLSYAEEQGQLFVESRNVSTIAEMRNLTTDDLLKAVSGAQAPSTNVMEGYVFAKSYFQSMIDGYPNRIPILTGNNAAESGAEVPSRVTYESYLSSANETFAALGLLDEFEKLYPATDNTTAILANNENATDVNLIGDWLFSKYWATGTPVYTYFFTHAPPNQTRGAYHEAELYYAFNNFYANQDISPWNETDYAIGNTMSAYWLNFIRHGNPNGKGLTHWPASTGAAAQTFHIDQDVGVVNISTPERIAFVEKYWSLQTEPF